MVNKPAGSSNEPALAGGKFRPTLEGDYFFVVMVVPVNAPGHGQIMYPTGTWHFMRHVVQGAAKPLGFKLEVAGTKSMSGMAFRIEVLDLDASFTSEDEVKAYLEGEGRTWLAGAIDHRICRATIQRRDLTEI